MAADRRTGILRLLGIILCALPLLHFLQVGTLESRVNYLIAFLIGLANPLWGFYALALLGPLYIQDQSKTHLLAGLEVFALGIIAGELRLLGRPIMGLGSSGVPNPDYTVGGNIRPVHWGVWPYFLCGLGLITFASFLTALPLVVYQETPPPEGIPRSVSLLNNMFYMAATAPEWTLKSLWNWLTGIAIAVIAARRANPLFVARWLKLAAIGLLVACAFSFLDHLGWLSLSHIRRPNPDPLHFGRLQGTAGHAGWFAEWIVLCWPGLLLWWSAGRGRRNLAITAALLFIALCLILTAARAAWLGVAVAAGVGVVYTWYSHPALRRHLPLAIGLAVVVLVIGWFAGGEAIERRVENLLRARDRANYYVSTILFLREAPFGLGLGTHFRHYEWWISPFFRWYQTDHVTAHSLWLHTLAESGPFVPLLLLVGLFLMQRDVRIAWPRFVGDDRIIAGALGLSIIGYMVVSFFQYSFYLRLHELVLWMAVGLLIGLSRKVAYRAGEEVESWRGPRMLLLCGVAALVTASFGATRSVTENQPREYSREADGTLSFWTGQQWRAYLSDDIREIRFSLYRTAAPVSGTITWPDGTTESFRLAPEQWAAFHWQGELEPRRFFARQYALRIDAAPVLTPAVSIQGSDDPRQLGVYVTAFRMVSHLHPPQDQPAAEASLTDSHP